MKMMKWLAALMLTMSVVANEAHAVIALPETLYYKFNEGAGTTTANHAAPGAGSNPATVNGHTLTAVGAFGSAGLQGVGGSSSTNFVNTGYATNLGTGNWTIAFWHSPVSASLTLSYAFGDNSANSFRAFNNGVAGADGMILRGGGLTDINVTGLSSTVNNHIAYVYDSSLNNVKGYLNGVLVTTVAQVAPNIVGTQFKVGGFGSNTALQPNYWMDEFQLYSRALDNNGVIDAMNANFTSVSSVPEPGSLTIVAGLGLIGSAVGTYRRRRANKVA